MKRILSLLLSAALMLSCCAAFVGCQPQAKVYGNFEYRNTAGRSVEITRYTGSDAAPEIPAEIDGRPVVSIASEAFCGSLNVENIIIPENVSSIGDYAFECCANLRTVTLPASMRTVGKGAFSGCTELESVNVADGIETYGDGAFFFCRNLRSFELTPSVRTVGNFMFAECHALQNITMSDGLEAITDRMFYACSSLSSTDIPSTVKTIGKYSFNKCYALQSIGNASGVETIDEYAFDGCSSLSSFTFSDKLTTIKSNAFHTCYGITAAALPASLKTIEPGAFMGINLEDITVDSENTQYTVADGVLFTKDMKTLVLYPNGYERTEYIIPDTVTTIAPYAFRCSVNLQKLTIPEGVETIGEGAFMDAHCIPSLVIPDSVKSLGDYCFYCTGFEEITIGSGVTELGKNAFAASYSLRSVSLPESLTTIGELSFTNCEELESITVPKNVTAIDSSAFLGTYCPINIESEAFVKDGGILYSADRKTLVKCLSPSDIKEFSVPDGVERIASYAFDSSMTSVTVPDSVTDIGDNAFGTYRVFDGPDARSNDIIGFRIYGSENSAAQKYAAARDISFFVSEPEQNAAEISLAGNETFRFTVSGTADGTIAYTAKDPAVASVSSDGTITAHKTGTTSVVAAVGTTYFKCDVTVTSDGDANPDVFDDSGYTRLVRGTTGEWVENYTAYNDGRISLDPDDNPFTSGYKGESYYEGMWAAQVENSEYDSVAVSMFGEGYHDQLAMMDHGLVVELSRYAQPDDVVLYSGTDSFERFIGKTASVKNIQSAIGTTITEPYFFSTALDQSVSHQFGGRRNSVFEIYADKDAIRGGYIECTVGQGDGGEYELLMPANARFEVIDAGVREVTTTTCNPLWDAEAITSYERFMKVRLIDYTGNETEFSKTPWAALAIVCASVSALASCSLINANDKKKKTD